MFRVKHVSDCIFFSEKVVGEDAPFETVGRRPPASIAATRPNPG